MLQCLKYVFLHFVIYYLMFDSLWCSMKESLALELLGQNLSSNKSKYNSSIQQLAETGPKQIHVLKWTITNFTRSRISKRTVRKGLGEKCSSFNECPSISLCMGGVCSCPYDYYNYISQLHNDRSVCRKKTKFGYFCTLTEDCQGYDSNSACFDGVCKCINGTHYIGSRNLLSHDRKCYKILEREGDGCEIDEQCSRLADNQHKCRCIGRCDCVVIDRYGGCTICHENIKRTFFGGAAFIIILLTSRLFSRMRQRAGSGQQPHHQPQLSEVGRRGRECGRITTSRTVPSVSCNRGNLQQNRHVTASLPDVFLIETHRNLFSLPTSQTTQFLPHSSQYNVEIPERNEDVPPSYEDIVESDRNMWNEPPPAYEEVAHKDPPVLRS